jgi:glutamate carboxypeptidase
MSARLRWILIGSLIVGAAPLACAADLSADERRLTGYIDEHHGEIDALLEQAVRIDSATENLAGVKKVGALYRAELDQIGFATRWIDLPPELKRAGHLFASRTGTHGKRLLLIGHLDTVLPGGTWRVEGNRAYGAGAGDMKGGDTVLLVALKALASIGALDGTQITVAFTGDEESAGHPIEVSRRDLLEAAKASDYALAFENAVRDTATVARRGSSNWRLEVSGIQGHSSAIFSAAFGDGAIYEAARILNSFREELRKEDGLTFSPAMILGGTDVEASGNGGTASGKGNVIARSAIVKGDLRFSSPEQLARARAKMTEIASHNLRRTSAKLTFEDSYPAMEATPANLALLDQLSQVSVDLGFGPVAACDPKERGAGDVSFVAPIIPSLDGLGARGGGAHTPGDFADTKSLPELAKRTAILIYRMTR